jgi:hypothetical protein
MSTAPLIPLEVEGLVDLPITSGTESKVTALFDLTSVR